VLFRLFFVNKNLKEQESTHFGFKRKFDLRGEVQSGHIRVGGRQFWGDK
jgi:hypothetical protein